MSPVDFESCSERIQSPTTDEAGTTHLHIKSFGPVRSDGLKQDFSNGVCQLITSKDMGPCRCTHPNATFETCEDPIVIKHRRSMQ